MKAYRVWNIHDEWQEIVYEHSASSAKCRVVDMYCPPDVPENEFRQDLRARHLPKIDIHANKSVSRGYIEWDKRIQRLSGIYPCERCGGKNGDGNLICAKCEDAQ